MRRMLLTAMASSMLVLAAPGMASAAHNGKRHHGAQHASRHARHAKGARLVRFTASTTPGAPSGTPATTPPTGETAGTVTSFTGGVLTITLTDGTVVSGKVTEGTELRCKSAAPPTTETTGDDEGGGDDQSGSDGAEHGGGFTDGQAGRQHDSQGGEGRGDGQDGNGDEGEESCTTTALVPGAVVREAELRVSGAGAVWEKVDLSA
jgi:hypothetical protein